MKKIIIALALAACGSVAMAATTDVCVAGTVTNIAGATDGSRFVRTLFAPTCGGNTVIVADDDGTKFWGTSASVKGQSMFGGSTNGGAVGNLGACNSGKACGTTAATKTAITAQMAAAAALGNT
jgi:hypothetical protein